MARIKARAGSLVAALGLAALPVREQEARRFPVLGAVHLAANGDGLSVTATTLDATIATHVEADAEGAVAVPLERLMALARHFPADAELAVTADDHAATIACDNSRFKLPVLPIADLPARHILDEETGRVALDSKIARDLFVRPAFAASSETTRLYLNGIFLHNVGDDLAAVTTDGHRLCRVLAPATTRLSTDRTLIVASVIAKTIDRLLGNATGIVTLARSERLFAIEGTGFVLVTKRIDQTYPDYERLIQAEASNVVTVSRTGLCESLARFAAVADPQAKPHIVKLHWDAEGLHLSAADGNEDRLAADVDGEAETLVSVRYLTELLAALRGDSVRIGVGGAGSMILVTDPDDETIAVVQMPRRSP